MKICRIFMAAALVTALVFSTSCFSYKSFDELASMPSEETTSYFYETLADATTSTAVENTTSIIVENTTAAMTTQPAVTLPEQTTAAVQVPSTQPQQETTTAAEVTTAPVELPDYSSYTTQEIIDTYAQALNKTRAYTGALTVNHSESFDASIKEAHPGGALTQLLADNIVKLVGSEGQQTLVYNNGYAVNADGETIPVLLPQRSAFSLPAAGVSSATISAAGDKTNIRIVLVPETVSMGQVPQYNSTAIGYLDTSGMDFKIITISRVDITYPGSVIDAVIRNDGYIESVTYTINMSTYAELSGMGISGYGTLEGAQTEKWQLIY